MRLRRALARRIGVAEPPAAQRRAASFPFISGDTFRAACNVVIDDETHIAGAIRQLRRSPRSTLFVALDPLPALLEAIDDITAARARLVVHNGDLLPAGTLALHAPRFERVFAVNWLGDRELVTPIPIGLENTWIGVNGVWPLFHDCVPSKRAERLAAVRSRQALLAFNDATCPEVRRPAREAFVRSGLDVDAPAFMDPTEYHRRLRDTMFVPSPRGNGVDCHRTWEAIYAGAVPVVLREHWSFEHLHLPVLVADSWAEAVDRIKGNARQLHRQILAESSSQVFAWHFLGDLT